MDKLEIHRFEELSISGTVSEAGTRKGTESTISLVCESRLPFSSERLLSPIQIKIAAKFNVHRVSYNLPDLLTLTYNPSSLVLLTGLLVKGNINSGTNGHSTRKL